MDRVAIESLTVFALPPVEFVNLAADLNCQNISIGLNSSSVNPHCYPAWSLRDRVTRQDMIAAMRDRNVSISVGEGLAVLPNQDVRDLAADLDLMCELGVERIATVSLDPDMKRTMDQIAVLAEMADAVGVETVIEFVPGFTINDLSSAVDVVRHVGRRTMRIMVDTMHLVRSGFGAADVAALDPDMIGYIQLCDVPLAPSNPNYLQEAMHERLVPGTGELPLLEILDALPRHLIVGVEVPMKARAEAGEGPFDRAWACVEATRKLLTKLDR